MLRMKEVMNEVRKPETGLKFCPTTFHYTDMGDDFKKEEEESSCFSCTTFFTLLTDPTSLLMTPKHLASNSLLNFKLTDSVPIHLLPRISMTNNPKSWLPHETPQRWSLAQIIPEFAAALECTDLDLSLWWHQSPGLCFQTCSPNFPLFAFHCHHIIQLLTQERILCPFTALSF